MRGPWSPSAWQITLFSDAQGEKGWHSSAKRGM
jgi:hypothetical protein